jgi:hypothetical protein
MQTSAVELARLQAVSMAERERLAMQAVAARWQPGNQGFLRQSHRLVEGAVCVLIGATMTTLALYNAVWWVMH